MLRPLRHLREIHPSLMPLAGEQAGIPSVSPLASVQNASRSSQTRVRRNPGSGEDSPGLEDYLQRDYQQPLVFGGPISLRGCHISYSFLVKIKEPSGGTVSPTLNGSVVICDIGTGGTVGSSGET